MKTLGIVNVVGSSIAHEADNVFYMMAGPEIVVATTKAYSAQLIAGYMLSIEFARVRGQITEEQYTGYISELQTIPDKINKILEDKERIQWFAAKRANAQDIFFVGRGIDYAICLAVVSLQLLGYYVSVVRGLDVDKPRNLAKSVTVE